MPSIDPTDAPTPDFEKLLSEHHRNFDRLDDKATMKLIAAFYKLGRADAAASRAPSDVDRIQAEWAMKAVEYARSQICLSYGANDEPTPYEKGLIQRLAATYRDGYLAACEALAAGARAVSQPQNVKHKGECIYWDDQSIGACDCGAGAGSYGVPAVPVQDALTTPALKAFNAQLIKLADGGCTTPFELECPGREPLDISQWCAGCLAITVIHWHSEQREAALRRKAGGE